MKTGLKPVLWSCAALLLLLSVNLPLLNIITLLLLMVPYVVLYATLPPKSFVLHLIPVLLLAFIIGGPATLIVGFFFLIPAIVMGHLYMKQEPASKVIRTVGVVLLAGLLLELFIFEVILKISLIQKMSSLVRTTVDDLLVQGLLPKEWDADLTEMMIRTMVGSIPVTFIIIAFGYAIITQYMARRAVRWSGGPEVPRFTRAKDWRLSRILVIIYLIAYAVELFSTKTSESFFAIALMNLVPLLSYVFAIQAVGFFFFLAHQRGWNKAVPILIAIPVLIFPPLSLIGVLDTAFPIRKSFTKP